jgi:hypothetical protein
MNTTHLFGYAGGLIAAVAAVTLVGCSSSSSDTPAGGAGGGSSGSAGQSAGGASGSGGSGANGGTGGGLVNGGSGGSGGSGGAGLPVPRVDNTEGPSVLDSPLGPAFSGDGACADSAVSCNGTCLSMEGQKQGTCTALKLGLGQTTSMALTAQALFYTAANSEILKYDLTSKTHKSLVRGLEFVESLAADDSTLYFSTEAPGSFFDYDVRSVPQGGGDVTVIAPASRDQASEIWPLPDKILFGIGTFPPYDLFTVPKAGGPATSFGGLKGYNLLVDGTTLYYLAGDFGGVLTSTSITAPGAGTKLSSDSTSSRFALEAGYIYRIDTLTYLRSPAAGGASEHIQTFTVNTYVLGRTPTQILLVQDDSVAKLTHILAMPFAGGTPTELVTVEYQELKAIAANATDLYISVGVVHAGGLLDVSLP